MHDLDIWLGDPYLAPFKGVLWRRYAQRVAREQQLQGAHPSLAHAMNNHLYYGLHRTEEGWIAREWAPHATALYLIGECTNWEKRPEFAFTPMGEGNWQLFIPQQALAHGMLYKWLIEWPGGAGERLPAYARRCVQDPQTKIFNAQVWDPETPYKWQHERPGRVTHPLIYEAHIGMSAEEPRIATFNDFRTTVLPRIARLGYNTLQLMAIQEHPYYGSFGYQVANFFAVSSRFGTPEELKRLIDEAHALGIAVILDIVHSHSVKNELEGLSCFDGTYTLYFHEGPRGDHPLWESRCFDYGKDAVLYFLLSNCKYWLEEFRFDGFRFDGVTSMMYYDHGLGRDFLNYDAYFDGQQDEDAITYLGLANRLVHQCVPQAMTIAEDVSGMPSLAFPLDGGGVGFDFRMSMGVADYWIKLIKEVPDEHWHVGDLYYQLTNKRSDEHTISYAECHDQAMVGDKTLLFRLLDSRMYTSMDKASSSLLVDRGMALHKMIRLLSLTTAGDGYLTFMGNEFGHPEWIDFPREGNNWSCFYARRQWSLAENEALRYGFLEQFDAAMIHLVRTYNALDAAPQVRVQDIGSQVLVFERGPLVLVFNFSPNRSYTDYAFEAAPGKYTVVLDSDAAVFGGFARNELGVAHLTQAQEGTHKLFLYLPARTCMALCKEDSLTCSIFET